MADKAAVHGIAMHADSENALSNAEVQTFRATKATTVVRDLRRPHAR